MTTITTVIPTFQRPALLRRAIRSVLDQTFTDFEIHVYDNASEDETASVVEDISRHDPRVQYFRHRTNIGLIQNFAFGINRVASPFFTLLSDDDLLLPRFFETAVSAMSGNPEAMAFVGTLIEAEPNGRILAIPFSSWREGIRRPPDALVDMIQRGPNTWTSMVFKRELARGLFGLDESIGLAADLDFEFRALARYPIVLSKAPCAVFFVHPSSATSRQLTAGRFALSLLRMLRNLESDTVLDLKNHQAIAAIILARFRQITFVQARLAAIYGQSHEAIMASNVLQCDFQSTRLATLIRVMAQKTLLGAVTRAAFRLARSPSHLQRRLLGTWRYRRYARIVAHRLRSLEGAPAAHTERSPGSAARVKG